MDYRHLLVEQPETGVHLITVNRPESLNSLSERTLQEFSSGLDQVAEDTAARVLLVTGSGEKAFIAGADIAEMNRKTALEAKDFSKSGMAVLRRLETLPVPVIAVVNGYALGGGCELAMACDWILASESAVFGQPEVKLGVTPGFGGTTRLPRLVGQARAMELILTGRQVKADEALRIGLANAVHPPDKLIEAAFAQARLVAACSPVAVRLAKEVLQSGRNVGLETACLLESEAFGLCFAAGDQKEGMTAFLEKRAPVWPGR